MGGLKGGRAGREEGGAKTEREEEEVRALENRLIFFFYKHTNLTGSESISFDLNYHLNYFGSKHSHSVG